MGLISSVLLASFVALIVVAAWTELRQASHLRRAGSDQPRHKRRLRRRLLGLLFLALAVAILINASTFERLVSNPLLRLSWIGMAFVSVLIAVWLAFRDLSETGRMAQEEAQRVVLESLVNLQDEIARVKQEKSGKDDEETRERDTPNHGKPGTPNRDDSHSRRDS